MIELDKYDLDILLNGLNILTQAYIKTLSGKEVNNRNELENELKQYKHLYNKIELILAEIQLKEYVNMK